MKKNFEWYMKTAGRSDDGSIMQRQLCQVRVLLEATLSSVKTAGIEITRQKILWNETRIEPLLKKTA